MSLAIQINGSSINPSLIWTLEFTDNTENEVDSLTFQSPYNTAKLGDIVKVVWGTIKFGEFEVEKINTDRKTRTDSIEANKVEQWGQKRTKVWAKTAVTEIVKEIATEMNLKPKCDVENAIAYIAQDNETNTAYLNRLAKNHGAWFAIKSGTLLFLQKTRVSEVSIPLTEFSTLETEINKTEEYTGCSVSYRDTKSNSEKTVLIGDEEGQVIKVRLNTATKSEALQIAETKLKESRRPVLTGSASLPGREIFAGQRLKITGTELKDVFHIAKVAHNISTSGWSINLDLTLA